MKLIIAFLIAFSHVATPAFAKSSAKPYKPEIWEFSGDVIRTSIKCELSRIATEVKGIQPKKATAKINIKLENTREDIVKLAFNIPRLFAKADASNERTIVDGEEIEVSYRIAKANGENCGKNNKFNSGIYNCLKNQQGFLRDHSDLSTKITCKRAINVKRVISAETGLKVWIVDIGPSGSSTEKGVYSFDVTVPVPVKE